jgi:phosphate transport system substrate-binding protein
MSKQRGLRAFGWSAFSLGLMACLGCPSGPAPVRIQAGGATFVNPIMQKWSAEYNKAKGVEIDYVAKGSSYGIEQMTERNLEFGCSDAPMKKAQLDTAVGKGGPVIHIPLIVGSVAVVYNVPEIQQPLRLTGSVLADIYARKITKWNDPQLAALNPGVNLPGRDIVVVARADSSGTSNIFSEYLSKTNAAFKKEIGPGTKPKWPQGVVAQEQNDGVAGYVKSNQDSIGYVEVLFAKKNQLSVSLLKNQSGEFVGPDAAGATAAAEEATKSQPTDEPYSLHDLTYSLTEQPGAKSYPISGMSYAVFFAKLPKDRGPAIVEFLKWTVTTGQSFAPDLEYAPLPEALQKAVLKRLETVTFE